MNNKLIKSVIATSLVFGSVAGFPLGGEGLQNKMGIAKASAAAFASAETVTLWKQIHQQLQPDEKSALAATDAILKDNAKVKVTDAALVAEIWNKISSKNGYSLSTYPDLSSSNTIQIMKNIGLHFDTELTQLEDERLNPLFRSYFKQLAQLTGVGDLTLLDLLEFQNSIINTLKQKLQSKTPSELVQLAVGSNSGIRTLLEEALDLVLQGETKFAKVFRSLGVTAQDLTEVQNKFEAIADPDGAAKKALATAYIRTQTTFSSTVTADGGTMIPRLKLFNYDLPNEMLTWTASGNANITTAGGNIAVNAAGAYTPQTAVITALDKLLNKLIYTGSITLTYTPARGDGNSGVSAGGSTGSTSGGGAAGAPANAAVAEPVPNASVSADAAKAAANRINDLLKGDFSTSQPNIVDSVNQLFREAAVIDLSNEVKLEGGVLKPVLDAGKLADAFRGVKELAQRANGIVKNAMPDAKPVKVVGTLELGTTTAKTSEIPLSSNLLRIAKENGVEAIAIRVNGVSLAVDVDQLTADTMLTITKQEKSVAAGITAKIASDVYEFDFTSGSQTITSFGKPVEVRLPITDLTGVDTELLVLTKLDAGDLVFKGGKYNAARQEFVAPSKSFSTYAILENKVEFKDTAGVYGWAGRPIAVAAAKGVLEGRTDGLFVPDGHVTRAEFTKMLVKAFQLEDMTASESFSDVHTADWHQAYIAAAVEAGIVEGRAEDVFEPDASITRAEMAAMASRAFGKSRDAKKPVNAQAALQSFVDADLIHLSLIEQAAAAAAEGIVEGEPHNKFNPNGASTRAQAAVVIYRLLNK